MRTIKIIPGVAIAVAFLAMAFIPAVYAEGSGWEDDGNAAYFESNDNLLQEKFVKILFDGSESMLKYEIIFSFGLNSSAFSESTLKMSDAYIEYGRDKFIENDVHVNGIAKEYGFTFILECTCIADSDILGNFTTGDKATVTDYLGKTKYSAGDRIILTGEYYTEGFDVSTTAYTVIDATANKAAVTSYERNIYTWIEMNGDLKLVSGTEEKICHVSSLNDLESDRKRLNDLSPFEDDYSGVNADTKVNRTVESNHFVYVGFSYTIDNMDTVIGYDGDKDNKTVSKTVGRMGNDYVTVKPSIDVGFLDLFESSSLTEAELKTLLESEGTAITGDDAEDKTIKLYQSMLPAEVPATSNAYFIIFAVLFVVAIASALFLSMKR